ncbi:DUF5654 family protein [Candidatus Aenigmatarchaeota archaeon]
MSMQEQIDKNDFEGLVVTAIITALAFVMGLFWRDAITETINLFVPEEGEGIIFKYIVAIIATLIVIVMAYLLIRFQKIELRKELKKTKRITKITPIKKVTKIVRTTKNKNQ